jgi:glycosyltransferase involved in cell wall biosynthesis
MLPNVLAVTFTIQIAERLLVLPHCNDIRIAIAGGGWENEEIEKYPNLIYLGFVEDIMAYIDHADICLLPYPQEAVCGGARNKALDYFARQKIVLSTNEGMRGLSEFKSGDQFFLSSYDPDQFAHDLYHIMQNHHGYQQVGVSARRLVETEYNWQKSAQAVLSAFNQII